MKVSFQIYVSLLYFLSPFRQQQLTYNFNDDRNENSRRQKLGLSIIWFYSLNVWCELYEWTKREEFREYATKIYALNMSVYREVKLINVGVWWGTTFQISSSIVKFYIEKKWNWMTNCDISKRGHLSIGYMNNRDSQSLHHFC